MFAQAKLIAIGVVLLAVIAGTAFVTHRFDLYELEAWKAAQYKQAAEDNAKAMAQMTKHDEAVHEAVATFNQEKASRDAQTNELRRKINAAPKTRSCADSPAIRALFDGLR
jgi:biopolymer transport protein ExbB/TolQ